MKLSIIFLVVYFIFLGLVLTGNAQTLEHKVVNIDLSAAYELPVEPQVEESFFQRVYKNATYVPEERPAISTDEHKFVIEGVSDISFEDWKKLEEATLFERKNLKPAKEEINFSSRKAEKVYKDYLTVQGSEEFKKLVFLSAKNGRLINRETVEELARHTINK